MAVTERNDALIQRDVLEEFAWDPEVELPRVGVVVADGVVTLEGSVGSYAQRLAAERAAQRIRGVRAVANELVVEPAGTGGGATTRPSRGTRRRHSNATWRSPAIRSGSPSRTAGSRSTARSSGTISGSPPSGA
jgi:hypothetical protein